MAAESARRRPPRIRKAPTVREQIEEKAQNKPEDERRSLLSPIRKGLIGLLKLVGRLLSPLAPVGRLLARFIPRYFVNSWQELKQVTWPNRRETWRLTVAVLVFSVVFGALVAVVDKGLNEVFQKVILR